MSDHDVDAHLLLASLLRHTKRLNEAREQLQRLERLDGAEKWQMEIGREHLRLDDLENEVSEAAPDASDDTADGNDPETSDEASQDVRINDHEELHRMPFAA